jgi:hypothetical protein
MLEIATLEKLYGLRVATIRPSEEKKDKKKSSGSSSGSCEEEFQFSAPVTDKLVLNTTADPIKYSRNGEFMGAILDGGGDGGCVRIWRLRGSGDSESCEPDILGDLSSAPSVTIPSRLPGGIKCFYFSPKNSFVVTHELFNKDRASKNADRSADNVRCFDLQKLFELCGSGDGGNPGSVNSVSFSDKYIAEVEKSTAATMLSRQLSEFSCKWTLDEKYCCKKVGNGVEIHRKIGEDDAAPGHPMGEFSKIKVDHIDDFELSNGLGGEYK